MHAGGRRFDPVWLHHEDGWGIKENTVEKIRINLNAEEKQY